MHGARRALWPAPSCCRRFLEVAPLGRRPDHHVRALATCRYDARLEVVGREWGFDRLCLLLEQPAACSRSTGVVSKQPRAECRLEPWRGSRPWFFAGEQKDPEVLHDSSGKVATKREAGGTISLECRGWVCRVGSGPVSIENMDPFRPSPGLFARKEMRFWRRRRENPMLDLEGALMAWFTMRKAQ